MTGQNLPHSFKNDNRSNATGSNPRGWVMAQLSRLSAQDADTWAAAQALPPELQHSVPKRQQQFLAGRYCAKHALQQLGLNTARPLARLADGTVDWPRGFVGSVSHTQNDAIALVAWQTDAHAIGVDLEVWMSESRAAALSERLLHRSEWHWQHSMNAAAFAQWLTIVFSAKESLFKALYTDAQRHMPLAAAAVEAFDAHGVTFCLTQDWAKGWATGRRVTVQYTSQTDAVVTWLVL